MTPAFHASVPASHPEPLEPAPEMDVDALGESIAALAARLHAATYELLVLLERFDARAGWNSGFLSCAHWLHWRTGINLGACREKVRVARALPGLPRISAAMALGQVSYAKVRALTRVATPETEQALLDLALAGTAAHVERFVRAWRRADDAVAAKQDHARHLSRQLSTWVDDEGMVVIRGRLSPEIGAVVQRALEAASDRLFQDARSSPAAESLAEELTSAQRRADALGLLAEAALSAGLDAGTAGDRYQVVVHVTADTSLAASHVGTGSARAHAGLTFVTSALEVDHGAVGVSAETSTRVACDASVVRMVHDTDGCVLDVGRKARTIPPSIRRAVAARDRTCRFPGCTSHRCDVHHIEHWADGGVTSLGNLMLLCRRHHRLVHEGGWHVQSRADGDVQVVRPNGRALPAVPAPVRSVVCRVDLPQPPGPLHVWDGTRFDLAWALDVVGAGAVDARCPTTA